MTGIAVGTATVIVLLWAATLPVLAHFVPSGPTVRGQVGDAFGVVNALFSGLALAGVVLAILMQREELQLQRDELRETRAELSRTAQAQEQSRDALLRQHRAMLLSAAINAQAARVAATLARAKSNPLGAGVWDMYEKELRALDELVKRIGGEHDAIVGSGHGVLDVTASGEGTVGPAPSHGV